MLELGKQDHHMSLMVTAGKANYRSYHLPCTILVGPHLAISVLLKLMDTFRLGEMQNWLPLVL